MPQQPPLMPQQPPLVQQPLTVQPPLTREATTMMQKTPSQETGGKETQVMATKALGRRENPESANDNVARGSPVLVQDICVQCNIGNQTKAQGLNSIIKLGVI